MVFSKVDIVVLIGLLLLVVSGVDSSTSTAVPGSKTVSNSPSTTNKPTPVSDSSKGNTSISKSLPTTTGKPPSTATSHTNTPQQSGVTKSPSTGPNVTSSKTNTLKPVTSSPNDSSVTKVPVTTKASTSKGSKQPHSISTVQPPGKSENGPSSQTTESVGNGTTKAQDQSTTLKLSTASASTRTPQSTTQSSGSTPHVTVTPQTTHKAVTDTKSNTSLTTQKPENSPSSTQKAASTTNNTTTAPTQKPGKTSNPTPKPGTSSTPTQKPGSISTPTQKPGTTSTPTQKPGTTSTPTQKPGTTSIPTQKPGSISTPTQKQDTTSTPTQKPGSIATPTQKPGNTSTPTKKPGNTSTPTQKPGNTSTPTQTPGSTSTPTQKPDNTATPTQTPTGQQSTAQQSTQKPSTVQTAKPTLPPRDEFVYINEIMLDKNGGFQKVELLLSKKLDVQHYTMVMVDGQTNKIMLTVSLKDMVIQKNGLLLVVTFNTSQTSPSMKDKGTGVAIYDTSRTSMKGDWTVSETGLVDALVIGKTYKGVSEHLTDILTPGVNPFILDPNKYGMTKTISRCSSDQLRSTDMYALINPSFGVDNSKKCRERLLTSSDFAIKIKGVDCESLQDTNETANKFQLTVKKLIHYIVRKMNTECQCGVTRMHIIDPTIHCCDGASVDMRFVAPNKDQLTELKDSYISFLKRTQHVNVENHLYSVNNNCYENCCNVTKHPNPKPQAADDTAKNVKVTVAVIVSCLIVFMIIVIVVIMYMRRKKSAVYQFRMSRLDEEDDLVIDGPDQDDFVGGQEATFDVHSRYQ
ncbi:uncharacterized protein LOC128547743 [Mercenaria mercenaria]|uniref:uncharacterized protein LOC128547743 n=1 Tax=Mercenaria mercenaria TaxID=6596 RepID=UPI00234EFAFF|nr:uncharacterized protein LOC128547743 [Mercenaria mercenaria]